MSSNVSPSHYVEDAFVTDADFKVSINQQMKVPDKISFNSELNGDIRNSWVKDNFNMNVPERILVAGQDQHIGTRAPPREIVFDNSLLSSEPYPANLPRVATPPRTLTLDRYPFPGVDDHEEDQEPEDQLPVIKPKAKVQLNLNDSVYSMNNSFRDTSTPPLGGESLTPAEEITHLRRQMVKLNRRVMALELENLNRMQKEKFIVGFGIAYFLLKVIVWMNRD
ncbi:transport and Golgi organization protein 11 [Anthonomus grandis grandis]|uniref:transport and Golgi organization protein 11 n=1 Tax=Anthonomus grandis grandis TaxID=2921223 RepID=UPI00216573B7|nr:transport and Golgi organization protein 11 [Anthonomus grandis grandis]